MKADMGIGTRTVVAAVVAYAGLATSTASADTFNWVGGSGGDNWNVAANWSPATVPSSATDLGVVPAGKTAKANADLGTLGNRPTIRIEAGGRVNQTVDLSTPIELNGGVFHNTGHMSTASPFTLLSDSTIEKTAQCCNGKVFSGNISGGGKLTFKYLNQFGKDVSFSGNNTFTGGADFLAGPSHTGEVFFASVALGQNGPPGAPNTLSIFPNFRLLLSEGATLVRDFTLAGGTLCSRHRGTTVTGTLTLIADSRVRTDGCCNGGGLTINGPMTGAYEVISEATFGDVKLKVASPDWTGGLLAMGSTKTVVQVAGAQGAGRLRVSAGSTLAFDATTDQDWFVTNDLASVSGATNATVQVEAGAATAKALTLCGRTLAPGGTNAVGLLTVNGRLRLAEASGTKATLAIVANGTNTFNGANGSSACSQLRVNGSLVDLGSQELRVTLGYAPQPGDVLDVVLNDGSDAITGTFLGLAEGGKVDGLNHAGKTYSARITYQANADGGSVGNDVRLYNLELAARGTLTTIR